MRTPYYVATIADVYRKAIDSYKNKNLMFQKMIKKD